MKKHNVEGLVLVSVEIYVENQYVKKQDNGESAQQKNTHTITNCHF